MAEIKINEDIKTIEDAGYNEYLSKDIYQTGGSTNADVYRKAGMGIGGTYSQENLIKVGGELIEFDSANRRILIRDGTDPRILIGYDQGGF